MDTHIECVVFTPTHTCLLSCYTGNEVRQVNFEPLNASQWDFSVWFFIYTVSYEMHLRELETSAMQTATETAVQILTKKICGINDLRNN